MPEKERAASPVSSHSGPSEHCAWSCPFGNSGSNAKPQRAGDRESEVGKGNEVLPVLQTPWLVGGAARDGAAGVPRPPPAPCARPRAAPARTRPAPAPGTPPCLPAAAGDPAPLRLLCFWVWGFCLRLCPNGPQEPTSPRVATTPCCSSSWGGAPRGRGAMRLHKRHRPVAAPRWTSGARPRSGPAHKGLLFSLLNLQSPYEVLWKVR